MEGGGKQGQDKGELHKPEVYGYGFFNLSFSKAFVSIIIIPLEY